MKNILYRSNKNNIAFVQFVDAKGMIVWLVGRRTDNRSRISEKTTSTLRIALE